MKNTIIKILRWIWEFPQCLLGLILSRWYNVSYKTTINNVDIYAGTFPGGISLGLYILMSKYSYMYSKSHTIKHEYGHSRQSLYLGPLYLPTVGLTSGMWNILRRCFKTLRKIDYYSIWPEN